MLNSQRHFSIWQNIGSPSFIVMFLLCMLGRDGIAQQVDTVKIQKGKRTQLEISTKNGILKEIIRMKDSLKDGAQEKYSTDGKLLQVINFQDGHIEGECIVYDYLGNIRERKHYRYHPETKKSMLNGEYKLYSNKKLILEGNYIDSMKTGQWTEYHYTGELKTKANFEHDLLVGVRKEYGSNGVLVSSSNSIILNQDGKQKSVYDGPYLMYDLNARQTSEGTYSKGMKEGVWKTWYGGKLNSLTTYKHDKKHGLYESYNDGVLQSRGIFYDEIELEGVTVKNVYDGTIEQYSSTGKPQRIEHFMMGKRNGLTEQYDAQGNLQQRSEYLNNLQHGKTEGWDAKGNKTYESNFKIFKKDSIDVSLKHGKELYWDNNQLTSESEYMNGLLEGVRKSYNKQGILIQHNTFKQGLLNGESIDYFDNGRTKSVKQYRLIEDSQGNKKSEVVGWRYEFDAEGNFTNKMFSDSMGKLIVSIAYQHGLLVQYSVADLLELNYFPDGKLMSFKLSNHFRQICSAHYYYRNGNTRKISFQNPENYYVNHVDFDDHGEVLFTYSDGHQNPDSMKPGNNMVEKMRSYFGNKLLPSPLYTDTLLNGHYQLLYGHGKPLADLHFKQNLPDNEFIFYDPIRSDTLLYKRFNEGIQMGYFTEKFAGLHCTFKGEVKSSKGEWQELYKPNGMPVQTLVKNNKGERILFNEYYDDGQIKSTQSDVDGTITYYDKNGMIYYENVLLNESKHVKLNREYFSTTKKLKSLKYYVNEKQDSLAETYFETGQLQSRIHFSNGKRNGMYEEYTLDGKLKRKGLFENDLSEGLWVVNDGKKTDSIYYEHGNVIVKPSGLACSCADTSISAGKMRFVPLLSDLIEYNQLRKLIPAYVKPIDSLHYSSIFCSNLQTSNGNNSGFASMKLLMFKECAFNLPANEQLKITLNPCRTLGYISHMDADVSYASDGSQQATARFYPKRISIEFLKGPVKSADKDYPNVTAMFNVSEIEFNEDKKLNFTFQEDSNACFTKAILKNYLNVEIHQASPLIFKRASDLAPGFYNADVNLNSDEVSNFFGLWVKKANLHFYHSMNNKLYKIEAQSDNLMVGGNFVAGKISIPCTKTGTDEYRVLIDQKPVIITSQALKMEWLKKGFTRFDIQFDDNTMALNLKFFVE